MYLGKSPMFGLRNKQKSELTKRMFDRKFRRLTKIAMETVVANDLL